MSTAPKSYFILAMSILFVVLLLTLLMVLMRAQSGALDATINQMRQSKLQQAVLQKGETLLTSHEQDIAEERSQVMSQERLSLLVYDSMQRVTQRQGIEIESFSAKFAALNTSLVASLDKGLEMYKQAGSKPLVLNIKFIAKVNNGSLLLSLLNELDKIARWRPVETRYCSVDRIASAGKLRAECLVNIYHWKIY